MMDNQKQNYYQILQIQPDAPPDVIKHNYKILLHKLKIHPDLGGNNKDAALINIAYETLSHPEKREEYDQKLIEQNHLEIHSRSHNFSPKLSSEKSKPFSWLAKEKNQRNYYRILQVHPYAHITVIMERYKALLSKSDLPFDLLHEAFMVLSDPIKRSEYDRLLKFYKHGVAVKKMQAGSDKLCIFCETPYSFQLKKKYMAFCSVCDNPLFFSENEVPDKSVRHLARLKKSGIINFYVYWPGPKFTGHLLDISPKGLRFNTECVLNNGQIIKIDGEKFKAAARVIHSQSQGNITSYGVCFHTVFFNSAKGNFVFTAV